MAAANSDSNEGRFSSNFRFIHKYRRHKKMARLTNGSVVWTFEFKGKMTLIVDQFIEGRPLFKNFYIQITIN